MTLCLAAAFIVLTAADVATTLMALDGGHAVELNPNAARNGGGIRIGFLVASNAALLVPLLAAFGIGVARSGRVPPEVLTHWWRHIADIFYISPLNDGARARSPLRLVTAAMTLLMLKIIIVISNALVVAGHNNPTSLLAAMWTRAGLSGAPRYWASYLLMVIPCYVGGVGLASLVLRAGQQRLRTL